MNYSEVRGQIKSGDLIMLSHKTWKSISDIESQIVRMVTESEYSHVCVAWVFAGRVFAIEAVVPRVRIMPVSNMLEENDGIYWIPMNTPVSDAELEFAMSKVGLDTYSKWEAIEGQLNLLDIGADSKWQCAEMTIAMRRLSGLDLGQKATPACVVQKALELGSTLNYVTK